MRLLILAAWLEVGSPSGPAVRATPVPLPAATPATSYREALASLARRRAELAAERDRRIAIGRARESLGRAITRDIIPAWFGTPWSFHGTSQTPGSGEIACGYFVATVLRDAGFDVDRVPLARQGSGDIVRTLVPADQVVELRHASPRDVIRRPPGLYVLGLDKHVGFLVIDARGAQLCHSSNRPPRTVRCEPALSSRSMVSTTHVLGPLLTDEAVDSWLR